jgi:uncharacterized protein (DUF2267 family)
MATHMNGRGASMEYERMVSEVEDRAGDGLDQAGAERALLVTLATLAERIAPQEASDLAAQLPAKLKTALLAAHAPAEDFSANEFLDRVAEREGVSRSEAYDHVRAVFNVLAEAVTGHELAHVREALPAEFDTLFRPPGRAKWPAVHAHHPHG